MELSKLMRTVKIKNEVYLLLQQQYYKERIQENRDVPTIDVLDEAIIPEKKVSPRIIYSTTVSFVFVLPRTNQQIQVYMIHSYQARFLFFS